MIFTEWKFLSLYLPLFLVLYYIFPKKARGALLLIGSAGAGLYLQWKAMAVLFAEMLANFIFGTIICNAKGKGKKAAFIIGVVQNVMLVLVLKFVFRQVPLGVGFAVFGFITYLSYFLKNDGKKEKFSLYKLAGYTFFLPKLVQGPIIAYDDFYEGKAEKMNVPMFEHGIEHMVIGLFFKVWLADRFAILWNNVRMIGFESISTPLAWAGIFAYSARLYFDFQGYSLMAIGFGEMLGYKLPKNFDHPYMSKTVGEFYRRWHMTLGRWFKSYIYIPMGGNRKGVFRTIINLAVVWIATGIWHGSTLNFAVWAGVLLILIICERFIWGKLLNKSKVLCRIYLWILIPLTWMVFAIPSLSDILVYLKRLFPFFGQPEIMNPMDIVMYGLPMIGFAILGIVISLPFWDKVYEKFSDTVWFKLIIFVLFAAALYGVYINGNNPFMYSVF